MWWRGDDKSRSSQLRRIARGWSKRSELQKPADERELPDSAVDKAERAAAIERLRLAKHDDEARDTTRDR